MPIFTLQVIRTTVLFLILVAFFFPVQTVSAADITTDEVVTLPEVIVSGVQPPAKTGEKSIDRPLIDSLPQRNGNATDLLTILPGLQFSEEFNSSFSGGEIAPAAISISGGRTYENNFAIDGLSNNNLTDPIADNPALTNDIPAHPQSIFLNSALIEEITVYDHNVPARFGGFTGGMVETTTKDPALVFGGRLFYRRTSDSLTKFHIAEEDKDDFYNSDSDYRQPEFTKQETGIELNIPIGLKSGILAAYSTNHSKIPLFNLGVIQNQERETENFFLKYLYQPSATQKLTLTALYAPYTETLFLKNTANSRFTIESDNLTLNGHYAVKGELGTLGLNAGLQSSKSSRQAPNHLKTWLSNIDDVPTSTDWGLNVDSDSSKEGGLGDLYRNQQITTLSTDWQSPTIKSGATQQHFNLGLQLERIDAELERKETTFTYSKAKEISDGPPCIDTATCIDGEQYLSKRLAYPAGSADESFTQYALYAEDSISHDRLTLKPGVRISRDTLMKNTDTAPRLNMSYVISKTAETTLIGGWNRYYGRNLMTYKLREALAPWVFDSRSAADEPFSDLPATLAPPTTRFSSLKTPYSNETTFGIVQKIFSADLELTYIKRKNRDQLAKERVTTDDGYYFTLNNNGQGSYESYRLAWAKQWKTQYLGINASYEKTLDSNEDYDDRLEEDDLTEQVWYKGEKLYPEDLPREDFNRPWTINLVYTKKVNDYLQVTNVTRYQSHYKSLEDSGEDHPEHDIPIYEEVSKPSNLTFDWSVSQSIPLVNGHLVVLNLDVFNVFNRKNTVGSTDDAYGLGRQIWLGMEYLF